MKIQANLYRTECPPQKMLLIARPDPVMVVDIVVSDIICYGGLNIKVSGLSHVSIWQDQI